MSWPWSSITLVAVLAALTVARLVRWRGKQSSAFDAYFSFTWWFFLAFVVADRFSFAVAIWILALVSFWAMREYFSLLAVRLQDRLGILGAYLSIPFMYYFIQTDWYGMFIVSIPVYAFLTVPFLVAIGGKDTKGSVFSIGAIQFGQFLFVFCIGHIGYLLSYAVWDAALLILNVLLCDAVVCLVRSRGGSQLRRSLSALVLSLPLTMALSLAVAPWADIPALHLAILAGMTPILVLMGHVTGRHIETDLGIEEDLLTPGRGRILDSLQSLFYAAPVMFHYVRYFVK
jgi:phosphatidate cytidylyltransferase